jgi:hypothetical protein
MYPIQEKEGKLKASRQKKAIYQLIDAEGLGAESIE